jgi:NTP pyrophosphatase (non-canonical NTP hydrolase)
MAVDYPDYRVIEDLLERIDDIRSRSGYHDGLLGYDRNGLRMAIAAIEDETYELYEAWRAGKRNLGDDDVRKDVRSELLDVAACAVIALAELEKHATQT